MPAYAAAHISGVNDDSVTDAAESTVSEPAPDKKPWRCVLCGDRFAREQTTGRHQTVHAPRR
jgi:hypothetical protein